MYNTTNLPVGIEIVWLLGYVPAIPNVVCFEAEKVMMVSAEADAAPVYPVYPVAPVAVAEPEGPV